MPVPVAVPPSGICPTRRERPADPLGAEPDLRGEAGELLAEGDRHRVHQVGPAGLDVVGELVALAVQGGDERVDGGQQVHRGLLERGEVDGGWEDVVGRLTHVDVVVRVGAVAGEVGDHLVGVHVRGGAGAGLEDVDGELVVVLAAPDRVAGGGDPLGVIGVEQPELGVGPRRLGLDPAEPVDDRGGHGMPGDGEVRHRLVGLTSPESFRGPGLAAGLLRFLAHFRFSVQSVSGCRSQRLAAT